LQWRDAVPKEIVEDVAVLQSRLIFDAPLGTWQSSGSCTTQAGYAQEILSARRYASTAWLRWWRRTRPSSASSVTVQMSDSVMSRQVTVVAGAGYVKVRKG
jgi:hypothetical protein